MNSTTLRNNFLAAHNLRNEYVSGYQAHHIIPIKIVKEYGLDTQPVYDEAWNCLMLPEVSELTFLNHFGSHPKYTEFVSGIIEDMMDVGKSFEEAAKETAVLIRTFYNFNETTFVAEGISGRSINDMEEFVKMIEESYQRTRR